MNPHSFLSPFSPRPGEGGPLGGGLRDKMKKAAKAVCSVAQKTHENFAIGLKEATPETIATLFLGAAAVIGGVVSLVAASRGNDVLRHTSGAISGIAAVCLPEQYHNLETAVFAYKTRREYRL